MVDKNLVNTFESMKKFDNFSKYSSILEHEFRDRSLKSFIASLKHYKSREKKNFIAEFYKKYPYQLEAKEIIDDDEALFEQIIGTKDKIEIGKQLNTSNSRHDKYIVENKKSQESEIPDSLRYSPNYDSIFKKVPSFKIGIDKKYISLNSKMKKNHISDLTNIKVTKINKNSVKEKISQDDKNKLFKTNIKINNKADKNNKSKKNIFLNLPPIIFGGKNFNLKNDNSLNKKYNTIDVENNLNNNNSNSIKYYQKNFNNKTENNKNINGHHLHINNAMDFKKMSSRNDKYIINAYSLDVPSFEKYSPKYEFIESNVKNIKFSPFGENKRDKKFLLKKILSSYKVPTEYQFIDNEKLLNDKDLINKQLVLNYNIHPYK